MDHAALLDLHAVGKADFLVRLVNLAKGHLASRPARSKCVEKSCARATRLHPQRLVGAWSRHAPGLALGISQVPLAGSLPMSVIHARERYRSLPSNLIQH